MEEPCTLSMRNNATTTPQGSKEDLEADLEVAVEASEVETETSEAAHQEETSDLIRQETALKKR